MNTATIWLRDAFLDNWNGISEGVQYDIEKQRIVPQSVKSVGSVESAVSSSSSSSLNGDSNESGEDNNENGEDNNENGEEDINNAQVVDINSPAGDDSNFSNVKNKNSTGSMNITNRSCEINEALQNKRKVVEFVTHSDRVFLRRNVVFSYIKSAFCTLF